MDKTVKQAQLHYRWLREKQVPWLNLSGIWLANAGFVIGQKIEIRVENKQLTIKAVE